MCRNTINVCVVCVETIQWTIPCRKKTADSGTTTLLMPTKCISEQKYTFSYHPKCIEPFESADDISQTLERMCEDIIPDVLETTKMCKCQYIVMTPTGSKVHHPNRPGLSIPNISTRMGSEGLIHPMMETESRKSSTRTPSETTTETSHQ